MVGPDDMIMPMLREMRAEINKRFDQADGKFDSIDRRLAALEKSQISFRQALGADSLLSKLVTGKFEERIELLERKMKELEATK